MRTAALVSLIAIACVPVAHGIEPSEIINVWPGKPPGETKELPPEADTTKDSDQLIAGRRVARIGNVSTPTLAVYRPVERQANGAAVIICPGGGHHILAYDLEGTEVAEWLNSIGVTGIVLKYRVPGRDPERRWHAAVQDAQRAVSLSRDHAASWGIDPERIGMLGFSAGGQTAALVACLDERQYEVVDDVDQVSARPDFAVLVYPGGLAEGDNRSLRPQVKVTKHTPSMFLVHAFDDPVPPANSLLMCAALKEANVPAELHLYSTGGHGYGMRVTDEPCTTWPDRCSVWLENAGWLKPSR